MQQDNKHTHKKLQELENLSLPDLSKMDDHWAQMKTALQPAVMLSKPKSVPVKKLFRWIVAAILIGGVSMVAYKLFYKIPGKETRSETTQRPAVIKGTTKDSLPAIVIDQKINLKFKPSIHKASGSQTAITDNKNIIPPVPLPGNQVDQPEPTETASLEKFFKQLEKDAQQFVINTKRDTLIIGEDGTALMIPANTFNSNGEVVITMKEFYSYEDIITNKLTTCSDGRQLVTGGMIHLMATADGKQVDIQPGRSIQWFVPDTSREMSQMQLFVGSANQPSRTLVRENRDTLFYNYRDTVAGTGSFNVMNWIPQERSFTDNYLVTQVKVLDMKNEPMKRRHTKKGEIGIFLIADNPKISREDLEKELKEKYDYYKVKIKSRKKPTFFRRLTPGFVKWRRLESTGDVGDSAWISSEIAQQYKLQATDTITNIRTRTTYSKGYYAERTFTGINMNSLAKRFSVDIRTLGWINCDRFYNNNSPRIEYYVDLKDTASNYYTLLVFDKMRSMIQGTALGNKVVFQGMPEGESAKVISIGIQNGKTVAAIETVKLSSTILTGLKFEETNPPVFRQQAASLDN